MSAADVSPPRPRLRARFDDLRSGTSLLYTADSVLETDSPAGVAEVLRSVQRAVDRGRWAFGYVAYEAASGLAGKLSVHPSTPFDMPLVWFGIGSEPTVVPGLTAAGSDDIAPFQVEWTRGWTPEEHQARVAMIKDRIAAGETYQCNLTERVVGAFDGDPFAGYAHLALGQQGAYNAYLDLGQFAIASASPELFFERTGDDLRLRPMKGTAPRGRYLSEDLTLADRLHHSAKDRAENLMIVDLIRNDLSKVAVTGTVGVSSLFNVERYPTVLQLTSEVTGKVCPGTDLLDLFEALFPCGSVTGAPKSSSMKIIRSLEPEPRGVYCGAIGWVAPADARSSTRFSVSIRTAVFDRATGRAVYGTGGGITWDSDPEAEQAEAVAKTAVLYRRTRPFRLLETMRLENGQIRNQHEHLRRMGESAEHLGFEFDQTAILAILRERTGTRSGPARIRMILARDGTLECEIGSIPPAPTSVVVALDDEPVDPGQWWLYHKTTLRDPYDRRLGRRPPGVDDVIMINTRGELTELTRASLAVELENRWWTPPVESGCLPGTERAALLAGGLLAERILYPQDLPRAQGLAVLSSLRGWRLARFTGHPADRQCLGHDDES